MQIAPAKELSPFIKHYLFLENEEVSARKLRLFSDGNTGMVLTFGGSFYANEGLQYPSSFLYGQISEFRDLYMAGKISIIIAVFQPHGINQLLGISAHELKDGIVETDQIFGRQGSLLHEQLSEQSSWKTKLQLLNTFFLKQAANRSLSDQSLIYSTLNYIVKNRGTISVNDLVKYTGYSERHIQRIFSECVGINPKKFGSIVKLHFFLNLLKYKSRKNSITGFCYEAGYSDQAHLIKEFKKYTGITPTQYLNHTNRLTTNFMEIQWDELQMSGLYNFQLNA